MKKFEYPEMEIVEFKVADVIATSNEFPFTPLSGYDENQLEITKIGK